MKWRIACIIILTIIALGGATMAWTAPTTRIVGEFITAPIWNTDIVDNLDYLKAEADKHNDTTFSDVSGSRAINTVYQNTSGKIRIAMITITGDVTAGTIKNCLIYCDNVDGATTVVAEEDKGNPLGTDNDMEYQFTIVIPSGYYYKAAISFGTNSVKYWTECDLL